LDAFSSASVRHEEHEARMLLIGTANRLGDC